MNKKVLSFLLALVMVLSMIPVSMYTAQEVSAESILTTSPSDHTHEGWTAWTGSTQNNGKYYLTDNTVMTWGKVDETITICLNGHNLTAESGGNRLVEVYEGSHVTICDCQAQVDEQGNLISTNKIVPSGQATYGGLFTLRTQSGKPNKNKSLTLENVVIDGTDVNITSANGGAAILVWSADSEITMENCVIKNCTDKDAGVISMDSAGTLKTNNVLFSGNSGVSGGAINVAVGSTIELQNTKFHNSSVTGAGGAIYVRSGSTNTNIKLTGCDFKNNSAGDAGGVFYASSSLTFEATNCNFDGNKSSTSKTGGGGAFRFDGAGTIKFTGCTFQNNSNENTSGYGGGAIMIPSGDPEVTISNCVFLKNTSKVPSGYGGGAILIPKGSTKLTVTGTRFEENSAYQGGAVAINGANNANSFVNCTFKKNTALDAGAAVLLWNDGAKVNFSGCTFEENSAARGSVILGNQYITLDNCTLKNNTATTGIGAINTSKDVTVTGNTQINGNKATDAKQADLYLSAENKLILGNVGAAAKVLVATSAAKELNQVMAWAADATPKDYTGVTYVTGDATKTVGYDPVKGEFSYRAKISDHNHVGWTAWGDDEAEKTTLPSETGKYYLVSDVTGAVDQRNLPAANITICLAGHTMTAADKNRLYFMYDNNELTICDCTAVLDEDGYPTTTGKLVPNITGGGAINMSIGTAGNGNTLNLENVIIDGTGIENPNGGSAIQTGNSKCIVNMSNCAVQNCTSTSTNGGTIRMAGGNLIAKNVKFANNKIKGTSSGYGGAVVTAPSGGPKIQMTNCLLENNTSSYQGGAIAINSGNTGNNANSFTNCIFRNNTANAIGGALFTQSGDVTLTDCEFDNNKSDNHNGGAINAIRQVNATRCTFTNNSAGDGGAVYVTYQSNFIDCTFSDNTCRRDGGAAYVKPGSGQGRITFKNCTITDNTAKSRGGAICNTATTSGQELNIQGGTVITGNTVNGVEQNVYLVSGAKIRGLDMTTATKVGVTAEVANGTAFMSMATGKYNAGNLFSDVENRMIAGDVDGATSLTFAAAAASVGGNKYSTLTDAIEASDGNTVKLTDAVADTVTLPATATIDMNGKDFADGAKLEGAAGGSTVCIADSTLTYDSADPVVIPTSAIGEGVSIPSAYKVGNRRYVAIETATGYEIHRVQLTITAKTLRPRNTGIGVKVKFNAANSILTQDYMKGFGMQFKVMDGETVITEQYKLSMGTEITGDSEMTVLITDFLKNADWADYTVTAIPYITLESGETVEVEGAPVTVNFKDMVLYADTNYAGLTDVQKQAVSAMCNGTYKSVFATWNLQNIAISE